MAVSRPAGRAKKLYQSRGFRQITKIDSFAKQGLTEYALMKEL